MAVDGTNLAAITDREGRYQLGGVTAVPVSATQRTVAVGAW